jgi:hypothetical protein|tara:strand:+ start:69 stop:443 length:375 start_codon:yes stop_codon:yes gene_type:complete
MKIEQTNTEFYVGDRRFAVRVNWDYNENFADLQVGGIEREGTATWSINDADCPIDIYTLTDHKNTIISIEDLLTKYDNILVHFYIDKKISAGPFKEGETRFSFKLASVEIHDNDCVFMFEWEIG